MSTMCVYDSLIPTPRKRPDDVHKAAYRCSLIGSTSWIDLSQSGFYHCSNGADQGSCGQKEYPVSTRICELFEEMIDFSATCISITHCSHHGSSEAWRIPMYSKDRGFEYGRPKPCRLGPLKPRTMPLVLNSEDDTSFYIRNKFEIAETLHLQVYSHTCLGIHSFKTYMSLVLSIYFLCSDRAGVVYKLSGTVVYWSYV